ncbi:hypothetical protein PHYC_03948 [Phycisphaerales bacterium]|nr:hypothetical protein PHYC_03948 [Phycisphaerales bacterium]
MDSDAPTPPPEPMHASDAPPELPAFTAVSDDRPCLACGYNIKGLAAEGVCPECGAPIQRSLRGNLLEFANEDYLKTLHYGAIVIEWGAFCPLVAGVLSAVLQSASKLGGQAVASGRGLEVIAGVLPAAGASVAIFGWFLFSRADAGQLGADASEKARRWVRIALITELILTLASAVTVFIPSVRRLMVQGIGGTATTTSGGPGGPAMIPWVTIIIVSAIRLIGIGVSATRAALGAWYVRHLAARVPDFGLQNFARVMIWLLPLLSTVGLFFCGLGPLAAWILSIVLIDKCRRRIRDVRLGKNPLPWITPVPMFPALPTSPPGPDAPA